MRIKELEEKIRFLEGEVEKGREASRKVKKLSSLFERWRAELYHKSDLLNQFRSVMNAPELMLDDQWRIIGYSSQFVRLCPQVIELARRKAHLGEVLADGEFSRIEERIGQSAALARLPYQEDQGWKLEYNGPNSRNEISRLWQVHCTCTRKNWEIAERDGELRLVHRAHAEDEVDC
ncbi:MAG: hypothetical protein V1794_05015, partial [Candidatus Glassbacteria bacterium]